MWRFGPFDGLNLAWGGPWLYRMSYGLRADPKAGFSGPKLVSREGFEGSYGVYACVEAGFVGKPAPVIGVDLQLAADRQHREVLCQLGAEALVQRLPVRVLCRVDVIHELEHFGPQILVVGDLASGDAGVVPVVEGMGRARRLDLDREDRGPGRSASTYTSTFSRSHSPERVGGEFWEVRPVFGTHIVSLMRTITKTAPAQITARLTNNAMVKPRPDRPNAPITRFASTASAATPASMAATEAVERKT